MSFWEPWLLGYRKQTGGVGGSHSSSDMFLVWDSLPQHSSGDLEAHVPAPMHFRSAPDWPSPAKKAPSPYCRTCNRAFATRGSLNRHMEMHRPFRVKHACHLCVKEFAWPSDLTTHLRISHGSPQSRHRIGRLRATPQGTAPAPAALPKFGRLPQS
ncbi:hypothetical protein IscW_ISCW016362 [Ixodes scapularis]|uniref:C2H2-type domain-containing protein n=1 Tax=Ixodes scapularis TaxID=6945 RepID=B7P2G7_IXOSC|nr:hypothetical protein IscW_ISCW016362 [Ixodes scapularis]|eukprot:XP_002402341.1 hypothetical protein IscW_ISCW016362 [Ixodes scapularis]